MENKYKPINYDGIKAYNEVVSQDFFNGVFDGKSLLKVNSYIVSDYN
jgi:hypothetical protein